MLWVIIIGLFLLLVMYLLFAPLSIVIDTSTHSYYIELKPIIKISAVSHERELLKIHTHIFFLNFDYYPIQPKKKKKLTIKKQPKKSKRLLTIKRVFRIIKSFKVKRFFIDIDTGDCIVNAKLFPVFALLNYKGGHFNINFNGRNKLVLHIQNRPIYIIKSFINF